MVEVGGGLRTYTVGGRSVLDGYADDEMCSGGRGQVLMPWPNRLGDGRFEWNGAPPADRPHRAGAPQRHPRTGQMGVVDRRRRDRRSGPHGIPALPPAGLAMDPRPRRHLHPRADDGLEVRTAAVNLPGGAGPCPFGAGWHPYLYAFGGLVDDAVLTFGAATAYVADERGLPQCERSPWPAATSTSPPAARSGPPASTMASPTWPATRSAGPVSSCGPATVRAAHPPLDGPRLHPPAWSSRATPWTRWIGAGGAWPWSR